MPVQPDGMSCVWGVDLFARSPPHGGEFAVAVEQQIRRPCLTGLGAALNSGPWIAVADPEPAVAAPSAPSGNEVEFTRPDGAVAKGPRLPENAAVLRKISGWQRDASLEDPSAAAKLVSGTMRRAGRYAAESGTGRCAPHLSRVRRRVSLLAKNCPCSRSDPV